MIDPLERALSELAMRAEQYDIPLIIGGGYGLLLRRRQIQEGNIRTIRPVPHARSTQDLDVFLQTDLLVDESRIARLRDIIIDLGYQPTPGAKYYQFHREPSPDDAASSVKIDLLAPLPLDAEHLALLKYDNRRVRPRGVRGLHAHTTPEACSIGAYLTPMDVRGGGRVYIPHPFTYAVLKLFALRDRIDDQRKAMGRYHAFDIYTILAMTTESQWNEAIEIRDNFPDPGISHAAGTIVHGMFRDEEDRGTLALRSHASVLGIARDELDVPGFLRDLHELFPPN
jgi:hypothetical protein